MGTGQAGAPVQWKLFGSTYALKGIKKSPAYWRDFLSLCWHYLSSRQVTLQVLSAQMSLTSVFGMGTGGPSSQSMPTMSCRKMRSSNDMHFSTRKSGCQELVYGALIISAAQQAANKQIMLSATCGHSPFRRAIAAVGGLPCLLRFTPISVHERASAVSRSDVRYTFRIK